MNIKGYKKFIDNLKPGESFYLNSISISISMIEYTKECVANGIITPQKDLIKDAIIPEAWEDYFSGKRLFPQMFYFKN